MVVNCQCICIANESHLSDTYFVTFVMHANWFQSARVLLCSLTQKQHEHCQWMYWESIAQYVFFVLGYGTQKWGHGQGPELTTCDACAHFARVVKQYEGTGIPLIHSVSTEEWSDTSSRVYTITLCEFCHQILFFQSSVDWQMYVPEGVTSNLLEMFLLFKKQPVFC